ncbi:HK97 family phage prohead protease [Hutsoniella sourekii]|uniref:HK97 family phage prohead protease n=1 Tax=Hutsoniella sourekii TaxID=87650 RepID=UPI000480E510|nr:HK97 family phage prohead protease [Hutsoniella sourekii]
MKEIRLAEIEANITHQKDTDNRSEERVLVGSPILYDTPTEIFVGSSSYTEIIERGALDGVNLNDTRLLYNHDTNKIPLARTPKTMQLSVDEAGLHMIATLADTEEARSVWTAVKRGDLSGMSFSFTVSSDGHTYDSKTNIRRIHKIDKLYEISVVPFPAYPTTSVEARAVINKKQEKQKIMNNLKISLNQLLFKD